MSTRTSPSFARVVRKGEGSEPLAVRIFAYHGTKSSVVLLALAAEIRQRQLNPDSHNKRLEGLCFAEVEKETELTDGLVLVDGDGSWYSTRLIEDK